MPTTVRGLTAASLALLLSTGAAALSSSPAAGAERAAGPGASGWWYDALAVEEAHRETTGEGVTVIMGDGAIDTRVPELRGADVELRENCAGDVVEPVAIPEAEHGTWMASLIVGTGRGNGPQGAGIAGIAPDAELEYYGMDVSYDVPGLTCKDDIFPYLREAVRESADEGGSGPIISWSLGNMALGFEEMQREVEQAGGVWVAAAGDRNASIEGQMDQPASLPGFVGVLSLDEQARPSESNPEPPVVDGIRLGYPAISAPGVDLPSIVREDGGWRTGPTRSGTSPATALVAGALALVRAKYPDATGAQLVQHLIHFDTDPERFAFSDDVGFGVVSLRNMLANDPSGWPDVNPLLTRNPQQVLKKYPMSVYDPAAAAASSEEEAAEEPSDAESTSASVEGEQSAPADDTADDGGLKGSLGPWITTGVALLVVLGGGATLARRTRTSSRDG